MSDMEQALPERKEKHGWKSLAVLVGITWGGGAAVALLTRSSMSFYDTLEKPFFAPPGWIFPVAWTILYALMAWSAWLAVRDEPEDKKELLTLYFIQLAVNLAWPVIFFQLHALGLAFVWLVLLWCLVLAMALRFFRKARLAGWLLTPYLAWVTFAGMLNFTVARMNP